MWEPSTQQSSGDAEGQEQGRSGSTSEIEEEIEDDQEMKKKDEGTGLGLGSIRETCLEGRSSGTVSLNGEDSVYVGVGKGDSSMDALSWALSHSVNPSTTILFLVHVFPETRSIPYPLGRIPKDQASQQQVETYMAQEREKRRALLQKFLNVCSASKVKVETILVESDSVAKAIQDLIPILNIRRLVLGINKSNARKLRSGRGNTIPEQILRSSAIDTCEVKAICEGKEMRIDEMIQSPSRRAAKDGVPDDSSKSPREQQRPSKSPRKKDQSVDHPLACICFISKPKTNN